MDDSCFYDNGYWNKCLTYVIYQNVLSNLLCLLYSTSTHLCHKQQSHNCWYEMRRDPLRSWLIAGQTLSDSQCKHQWHGLGSLFDHCIGHRAPGILLSHHDWVEFWPMVRCVGSSLMSGLWKMNCANFHMLDSNDKTFLDTSICQNIVRVCGKISTSERLLH